MSIIRRIRISLRLLIVFIGISSALIMFSIGMFASYVVQRQALIDRNLDAVKAGAENLAGSLSDLIGCSRRQLEYSAGYLAGHYDDEPFLDSEIKKLQDNNFSAIVLVDPAGWVLAASPGTVFRSQKLESLSAIEALREQRPLVSAPYTSEGGNMVVLISHPVTSAAGHYLGYIGIEIKLKDKKFIRFLFGEHRQRARESLYIVDTKRRLRYHPQLELVGALDLGDPIVNALNSGIHGSMRLHDSQGVDMLAGYASVPQADWGVVVQRPTKESLEELNGLMLGILGYTLPVSLLLILYVWWLARLISWPLWQLADGAQTIDRPGSVERLQNVRSWYFEASELQRGMLAGISLKSATIGQLRRDVQTDPLTGLQNRRGLEMAIEKWNYDQRPFAVVALDIDHFKRVNDVHGHDMGDMVLKLLAQLMQDCSRGGDVLCRVGGDEFLMLLPDVSSEEAAQVAERLRCRVEESFIEPLGQVTISLGVASWPHEALLKSADEMLYKAKQSGRNRVIITSGADQCVEAVS